MLSFHKLISTFLSCCCLWMMMTSHLFLSVPIILGGIVPSTMAFTLSGSPSIQTRNVSTRLFSSSSPPSYFELSIDMPPSRSGLEAKLRFKPILQVPSEVVVVRYTLPFGLDVVPKDGMAICTKDGKKGGEKVGDVLRYTSQWTLGLPQGDGVVSTAVAFSGGVRWQCTLFDVMKARVWQQVVEALVSNSPQRTDEVVLVFERPLPSM